MDLLAQHLPTLHNALRGVVDALGWEHDYETSLEKTISGFIFRIDKTTDKEKWVNYPVAIEVIKFKNGKVNVSAMKKAFTKEKKVMRAQFNNLITTYASR